MAVKRIVSGELVKHKASILGFDLCRIIPVGEAPHFEFFEAWLAQGCAGKMGYLERNTEKRRLPVLLASANQGLFRSIVVLAVNYYQRGLANEHCNDMSRGVIASYALGEDYHDLIRPLLNELDTYIAEQSGRTSPGKCLVDSGPVLERDWAQLAGIGFTGKNCCTIHPRLGGWLLLATVLVPEEIEADATQPVESITIDARRVIDGLPVDGKYGAWLIRNEMIGGRTEKVSTGSCGKCSRCLTACPTNAFVGPYYLDPRRCISYWTIEAKGSIPRELRPLFRNRIFGCDVCQEVCPWNRRLAERKTSITGLQPRAENKWLPLLEGFNDANPYWLVEEAFTIRFDKTPMLRAGRVGMLRNVCVALGNWGNLEALSVLRKGIEDQDLVVRAHAAWAVGQVILKNGGCEEGLKMLEARLGVEEDESVREEIGLALEEGE
jgi:epoxyqueuosine reductase